MKKQLLLLVLVYITITAVGQNSIPNGGFETWNSSTYDYPQNYPYNSISELLSRGSVSNLFRTSDAHSGSSAVKLTTTAESPGYFLNKNPNKGDPTTWTGGILYNQKPTGISGYYKYNIVADDGLIMVAFSKAGRNIGTYMYNIVGIQNAYKLFDFTFSPALTEIPDSVAFGAVSTTHINDNTFVIGGTLYLDDVSFTGVPSQPALFNGGFELWEQGHTPEALANWYSNSEKLDVTSRTTDSYKGKYALVLKTYIGTNNQDQPSLQMGNASTGYNNNNNSSSQNGGFPFSNQIDTLAFYYKYAPARDDDHARINFYFKKTGSYIGWGQGYSLPASASYQYFEIPFRVWEIPDSVIVQIQSSDGNNFAFAGSELKIDEIHFKSQPANLGTASNFALFTANGAIANNGTTRVTGDIGTNLGTITGFPPGTLVGQQHVADAFSAQTATDVAASWASLSLISGGTTITTLNDAVLNPGTYRLASATTLTGNLTLDGKGNPNSIFIFKLIDGLTTSTSSKIILINKASMSNVYWQIWGNVSLGVSSVFKGSIVANGNISLLESSSLFGRGLSLSGAISLQNNIITLATLGTTTWKGTTSADWNTATNWTPNIVPTALTDVTIPQVYSSFEPLVNQVPGSPAICNDLTIKPGGVLTIAPGKALTVSGILTNDNNNNGSNNNGVIIQSNATGTGSLITGFVSGSGLALAARYMTMGAWHIVSSPLSGQTVKDFLTTNTNIPTNVANSNRGMMDYIPATNTWNTYFTNTTGGILETGKGFSMRTITDATVKFIGTLRAGTQTISSLSADNWNCIGNPYTSAIGINRNSSSTANFLNVNVVNTANIDPSYGAIYVWNQLDINNHGQGGQYTIISNTPTDEAFDVQQGQAFMVKMKSTANSVSFTPDMQFHSSTLALKSSKVFWPTIKILASVNDQKSSTIIAFNSAMTKGLDPTYDAGLLKGGSDLLVYSRLVEDNGIPFAIQTLPDNDFSNMIIPIGLDFKTGGEVVFSSENMNLPQDCKVILEDMLTKTFTDLSRDTYKTKIAANSIITDRFRLKTSSTNKGLDKETLAAGLTAYAYRNIEIRVSGAVSKNAVATLYDVHGRIVLVKILEEGNLNIIPTPNIKTGIYMLSVNDKGKSNGFKILVRE